MTRLPATSGGSRVFSPSHGNLDVIADSFYTSDDIEELHRNLLLPLNVRIPRQHL
jgi:hypothetical protein